MRDQVGQLGIITLLHRSVESVHIEMEDDAIHQRIDRVKFTALSREGVVEIDRGKPVQIFLNRSGFVATRRCH